MSDCTIAILSPFWIGIVLNIAFSAFNVFGMAVGLRGAFIDWYLGYGSLFRSGAFKIMGAIWALLITWSVIGGISAC